MKRGRPKEWTESETSALRAMARRKVSAEDIARAVGRRVASVRREARRLGLLLFKKHPT